MKFLIKDDFLPPSYIDWIRLEALQLQSDLSREGYNNRKTMRDEADPRVAATTYVTNTKGVMYNSFRNYFWQVMEEELAASEDSALVHASWTRVGKVLFSSYGNGDNYGKHVDIDLDCVATAVLMLTLTSTQKFSGGAFLLENEQIDFKHNRLIVFPSCRMHGVEPVVLEQDSYENRRFTLQYFISSVTRKGKYADESYSK